MDRSLIEQGLRHTSSTGQRIEALREAGFTVNTLAVALGVTRQSLRNWQKGVYSARPEEALEKLDNLRFAMGQLVTKNELEPNEAAAWIQSLPDEPPYVRPLDVITEDPLKVFDMLKRSSVAE